LTKEMCEEMLSRIRTMGVPGEPGDGGEDASAPEAAASTSAPGTIFALTALAGALVLGAAVLVARRRRA
jgi:hypothetical protein